LGTPFLLVPEATTVDDSTLKLLAAAKEKDVKLSHVSPLGVRFHYLKGTSSEVEKLMRIEKGTPGSPCTEKHLSFNTEFTTEPICTASIKYQQLKIAQLKTLGLPEKVLEKQVNDLLEKECLCVGLSNSAAINYSQTFVNKLGAVTICPGPNIVNFNKTVSLQTMSDHIYGRTNILGNTNRPHMFVAELYLYIDYFKEQLLEDLENEQYEKKKKFYIGFYQNLRTGISYYKGLIGLSDETKLKLDKDLDAASLELDYLNYQYEIITNP